MKKIILCFLVSASLIACTNQETKKVESSTIDVDLKPDLVKVKAEIATLAATWESAFNSGNFDLLMSLYSDDVIQLQNNTKRTNGIVEARKGFELAYYPGIKSNSNSTDVFGDGNIITEIGTTSDIDLKGIKSTGKYITVWKKQNGKYLIIAEMTNADKK